MTYMYVNFDGYALVTFFLLKTLHILALQGIMIMLSEMSLNENFPAP